MTCTEEYPLEGRNGFAFEEKLKKTGIVYPGGTANTADLSEAEVDFLPGRRKNIPFCFHPDRTSKDWAKEQTTGEVLKMFTSSFLSRCFSGLPRDLNLKFL